MRYGARCCRLAICWRAQRLNNFHDINGFLLVGIEPHFALLLPGAPVPFIPTPMPRLPKLNFLHPFTLGDQIRPTVLFNGVPSVSHWHQPKYLWPHLGLPPFPFDILTPLQILFGVQTCWLPKTDVFAEGLPTTPAICGHLSINLDCWDFGNLPSSLVVQPGTVVTTASMADYSAGLKALAVDFAICLVLNAALAGATLLGLGFLKRALRNRVGLARLRPRVNNAVRDLLRRRPRRAAPPPPRATGRAAVPGALLGRQAGREVPRAEIAGQGGRYRGPPEGYNNKLAHMEDFGPDSRNWKATVDRNGKRVDMPLGHTFDDFFDQRLYDVDSRVFASEGPPNTRPFNYVIDNEDNIFVGVTGKHSQIANGENVYGAGQMWVDNAGNIVRIDNGSGHYLPDHQFYGNMDRLLGERGIDTSGIQYWTFDRST